MAVTPYSSAFFSGQEVGSVSSAAVIVPLLLQRLQVRSVVDVGCGVGGWLKQFELCGVSDYLGIDGNYVPRSSLKIPEDRFRPADLTNLTALDRRFDLACSLEVAEHLPPEHAERFVDALVALAPVVLFSAAIPSQGGTDHINEKWQSYWAQLFQKRGYVALDFLRPEIFYDARVEWWYRQNVLVFCEPGKVPDGLRPVMARYELDRIHPGFLELLQAGPQSGRGAAKSLMRDVNVLAKAVVRKVRGRAQNAGGNMIASS